jgi:hypothetical protein
LPYSWKVACFLKGSVTGSQCVHGKVTLATERRLFFLIAEPRHARNGVVPVNVKAAIRHALTPALRRINQRVAIERVILSTAERARALEALEQATKKVMRR